jgi:hypothetical protein
VQQKTWRVVAQTCYIPARDFTTFFSFLTFLLLFAQHGGAIWNYGALTVKYGNFTGNSADGSGSGNVSADYLPPSVLPRRVACYIPARELEQF